MDYSKEDLLNMYYHLVRGRIFTEKMHKAVNAGLLKSSFHSPHGQEAAGVGIVSAMRDTDWLVPTHRLQTGSIMRLDLYGFIAELFAKVDGIKKGSAYDLHISDYDKGRVCVIDAVLGTSIPTYTGFAWALKRKKKDEVVVIVHGDGGCSEGAVFEGWNLAALYKVPAVFVIDNNEWAMTVPLRNQSPNPNISEKAIPMGLSTKIVDGYDILAVRKAMDEAIEKARRFEPNVVEIKYRRWDAHFVGQGSDYRDDNEQIEYDKINNDPVIRYEKYLLENGLVNQEYIEELKSRTNDELDGFVKKAADAPVAEFNDIYLKSNIYANPSTGGDL